MLEMRTIFLLNSLEPFRFMLSSLRLALLHPCLAVEPSFVAMDVDRITEEVVKTKDKEASKWVSPYIRGELSVETNTPCSAK